MAKRRIGALISIEQGNSLEEFINTGIPNSFRYLESVDAIFHSKTHRFTMGRGIRDYKIAAAACYLPLSENKMIRKLGTRHRAAIGLSDERCDYGIFSEETGKVSVAIREKLHRELSSSELVAVLSGQLVVGDQGDAEPTIVRWVRDFFKGGHSNG